MKREDVFRNFLYGILLSAFLVLYFVLSMNSRLVADDFYFLKNFDDHGFFQSMLISWNSWITRWASILGLNVIFSLYNFTGNFLFFHIITLLMLCFALYRFSSYSIDFFIRNSKIKAQGLLAVRDLPRHSKFTVLMLISFFMLTSGQGEIFFWATSSAMYLWGFIAVCFLTAEVFKEGKSFLSVAICAITAAYAGGAAEAVAIPALIILLFIFFFQLKNKIFRTSTVVAVVVLFISILISYLGEGRALRQSALPELTVIQSLILSFKSLAQIELYFLSEKFLLAICFYLAWIGFGAKLPYKVKMNLKYFALILGTYIVLCFIFVFPTCFLLGEIPPTRARILIGFLNSCLISIAGLITGSYLRRPLMALFISAASELALVAIIGALAMEQKEITTGYAASVDNRMQKLKSFIELGGIDPIELEPLSESGLLLSSEISADSTDFRNQHLKNYLRITNSIVLKNN